MERIRNKILSLSVAFALAVLSFVCLTLGFITVKAETNLSYEISTTYEIVGEDVMLTFTPTEATYDAMITVGETVNVYYGVSDSAKTADEIIAANHIHTFNLGEGGILRLRFPERNVVQNYGKVYQAVLTFGDYVSPVAKYDLSEDIELWNKFDPTVETKEFEAENADYGECSLKTDGANGEVYLGDTDRSEVSYTIYATAESTVRIYPVVTTGNGTATDAYTVTVNDDLIATSTVEGTSWNNNFYQNFAGFATLNKGINTIKIKGSGYNIDKLELRSVEMTPTEITLSDGATLEAETAQYLKSTGNTITDVTEASGGKIVENTDNILFVVNSDKEAIVDLGIKYACNNGGQENAFTVYVNGVNLGSQNVVDTGSWTTSYATVHVDAVLHEGINSIELRKVNGNYNPDCINITAYSPVDVSVIGDTVTVLEAENANYETGDQLNTTGTGSGSNNAFLEYLDDVKFVVKANYAGMVDIVLATANGNGSDQADAYAVYVNGSNFGNQTSVNTGSWSSFEETVTVSDVLLNKGYNVIDVIKINGNYNFDYIKIVPKTDLISATAETKLEAEDAGVIEGGVSTNGDITFVDNIWDDIYYYVNVDADCAYELYVCYTSNEGNTAFVADNIVNDAFNVTVNDVEIGVYDVPVTGSWDANFTEFKIGEITLTEGYNYIKIEKVNGGYNVDYIKLVPVTESVE